MKVKRELLLYALIISAMTLSLAGGVSEPPIEPSKASMKHQEDARFMDKCLQLTPGVDIYTCYHSLMASYACAAMIGGEAENKAKENMERFYKPLHNDTIIGIKTIYNKATELGCNAVKAEPNPK